MASIDFSIDSRIRKKYIPLINQQRYLRHIRRIGARNLSIPKQFLDKLHYENYEKSMDLPSTSKECKYIEDSNTKLNIKYYFTIHFPSLPNCIKCKLKETNDCNCDKLIYCSELIMNKNPSWKDFKGSSLCSPSISQFIIRVYFVNCKNSTTNCIDKEKFGTLFLEWNVHLSGLVYIGEEFPCDRRLSENSIIFGFPEGYYTSVCSVASEILLSNLKPPSESVQITEISLIRNSYCLNILIRMQMLQCIIHAREAQLQLERLSIKEKLEKDREKQILLSKVEKMRTSINFLNKIVQRRKERIIKCRTRIDDIADKIQEYNMEMSSKIQLLKEDISLVNELRTIKLNDASRRLEDIRNSLAYHRKMLIRKIFKDIYIILPSSDGNGFTINDIFLPNINKFDYNQHQKTVAIGLGYVCHLVLILSKILNIFLSYKMYPFGSHSSILDLFNKDLKTDKFVPLYAKSKSKVIFLKYSWNLLNITIKFIIQLMNIPADDSWLTLNYIYHFYKERFWPDDDCFIEKDSTLNRFNISTPSAIHKRTVMNNTIDLANKKLLLDINEIKIDDLKMNCFWKEIEQMTLKSIKINSSSQHASFVKEIKETIMQQRQQRRMANSKRINELTSLVTPTEASSSTDLLMPNVRGFIPSLPQNIHNPQRRFSVAQCSINSDSTSVANENKCPSPIKFVNYYSFQQFNSMKRMQNITGHSPKSLPTNHTFLTTATRHNTNTLSLSLDNGLNFANQNQNTLIHSSSNTSSTNLTAMHNVQSASQSKELLNVNDEIYNVDTTPF